jgi:hypothetical protein
MNEDDDEDDTGEDSHDGYMRTNHHYNDEDSGYTFNEDQQYVSPPPGMLLPPGLVQPLFFGPEPAPLFFGPEPAPKRLRIIPQMFRVDTDQAKTTRLVERGTSVKPVPHPLAADRIVRTKTQQQEEGQPPIKRRRQKAKAPSRAHDPPSVEPAHRVADKHYNSDNTLMVDCGRLFCSVCTETVGVKAY